MPKIHFRVIGARNPGKLKWAGTTARNKFLFAAFLKNAGLDMSKNPLS